MRPRGFIVTGTEFASRPGRSRFRRTIGRGVGNFRGTTARLAGGVREHRQSAARPSRGARQGDRHPAVARCESPTSDSAVAHRRVRARAERKRHWHRHRLQAALRPPPFSWRRDRCVSVPNRGRRRGTRLCPGARGRVGRSVRPRTRLVCHAHRCRRRSQSTRRAAGIDVPASRPVARGAGGPQRRLACQRRPADARRAARGVFDPGFAVNDVTAVSFELPLGTVRRRAKACVSPGPDPRRSGAAHRRGIDAFGFATWEPTFIRRGYHDADASAGSNPGQARGSVRRGLARLSQRASDSDRRGTQLRHSDPTDRSS